MARTREFDQDEVLDAAMEAFRHGGFGAVSIRTLEEATGLKAGSIYNSFGDKDGLFQKAVEHYNKVVVAQRLRDHLDQNAPLDGLRSLFLSLLDEPGGGSSGCLLTNSAVESGLIKSGALSGVHVGFGLQEAAFVAAIEDIWPDADKARTSAVRLLALYQGVLLLIRSGYSKDALRQMINLEFDMMKGQCS